MDLSSARSRVQGARSALMLWLVAQTLVVSLATIVPQATDAGEGEPPSVINDVPTRYNVPMGTKSFKLVCPVKADPPPMIQWKKNGEAIGPEWSRFKLARGDRELRIKNVMSIDSGHYTCEAVNGFGVRVVEFTLIVFDENAPEPIDVDDVSMPEEDTAPMWIDFEGMRQMTEAPIMKRLQTSLELKCKAIGNPRPEVEWRKDGLPVQGGFVAAHRPWLLALHHLTEADSGQYTCHVHNKHGRIEASFLVKVTDADNAPPEFDQGDPLNSTVREGQTATFQCKVRSSYPPLIRWLKQLDDVTKLRENSTIISANGMDLEVLDQFKSETLERPDNIFLNRLIIPRVMPYHSGVYICVVTNPAGHMVYRSAHLTVVPVFEQDPVPESFLPMHLVVGVPIVAFILVLVGYAICFLQRHKQKGSDPRDQRMSMPPPPQRPPPSLPPGSYKDAQSPSSAMYSHNMRYVPKRQYPNPYKTEAYHQFDPAACVPLNSSFSDAHDRHMYETTPQPPYEVRWAHPPDSDYDSDVNYPNGRLQPYPSMYSCR